MKRLLPLVLFLLLAGCRGSSSDADFDPIAQSVAVFQTGLESFQTALTSETSTEITGTRDVRQTKLCEGRGASDVSGTITEDEGSGTFDLESALEGCQQVDGTMQSEGSYIRDGAVLSFQGEFEGGFHDERCEIDVSALTFVAENSGNFDVSGRMTGTCISQGEEVSISCNWEDADANDVDALIAQCFCAGFTC